MNPLTYIQNMTSDDVQRLVRTVLQTIAGALMAHGVVSTSATWVEPVIGAIVFIVTLGWQLYGNRIQAKINEVASLDVVDKVHVTSQAVANAAPSNVIVTPLAPPPASKPVAPFAAGLTG